MKLSARRRHAELAARDAQAHALAYRQSADRLQSRLRHDWRLPLVFGLGTGAIAGMVPVAATVRAGSAALRMFVSLSSIPYAALARLSRNASAPSQSSPD